jgi:hypothetical protein
MLIKPMYYPYWDDLLYTNTQATFFHTYAWMRTLLESYKYSVRYFTSITDGMLDGLFPVMGVKSFLTGRRGVILPFSDICEPIANDSVIFNDLFHDVIDYGHKEKWDYLEIRGDRNFLENKPSYIDHYNHILDLNKDIKTIFNNFTSATKRNIRKAESCNLRYHIDYTLESVKQFYQLHCYTRRKHGLVPQPWKFFENFYKYIIKTEKGVVATAYYQNKLAASSIFVLYRDQITYKYGTSDSFYLCTRPNNFIIWNTIKWACENKFKIFDFGRTEPDNPGLLRYKRNWGATEKIIRYFKYNFSNDRFIDSLTEIPSISYKFSKHLPICFLKIIGQILYRHMG